MENPGDMRMVKAARRALDLVSGPFESGEQQTCLLLLLFPQERGGSRIECFEPS